MLPPPQGPRPYSVALGGSNAPLPVPLTNNSLATSQAIYTPVSGQSHQWPLLSVPNTTSVGMGLDHGSVAVRSAPDLKIICRRTPNVIRSLLHQSQSL